MITEWLLSVALGTFSGLLSNLPAWTVDTSSLSGNATSIAGSASALNGYFPMNTLALCLAAVFAVKFGMLGWRGILFVYHQFWGSS